jgi:hypothetical protein
MGVGPDKPSSHPAVPVGARFSWARFGLWLPAAMLLGGIAAWIAVLAQFYFAPWLIFPIIVGVGLGGMLVVLLRFAQVGNRPTIFLGCVLAAAVAVVGQHYLDYRHAVRLEQQRYEKAEQLEPKLRFAALAALPPPVASFREFMQREAARERQMWWGPVSGWQNWAAWGLDAAILLAATLAVVYPATRQPYCDACRTWYRTIRSGRTDLATARRLAEQADLSLGTAVRSARYRFSCCHVGCGPTRFELSWEEPDGRTFLSVGWLAREQRNRVMEELDDRGEA